MTKAVFECVSLEVRLLEYIALRNIPGLQKNGYIFTIVIKRIAMSFLFTKSLGVTQIPDFIKYF